MAANQKGGSSEKHAKAGSMSKGGKSSGGRGSGGSGGSSDRSEAARKGGEAVSRDREHMSEMGRKGGEK
jgi:uncharacterized protein